MLLALFFNFGFPCFFFINTLYYTEEKNITLSTKMLLVRIRKETKHKERGRQKQITSKKGAIFCLATPEKFSHHATDRRHITAYPSPILPKATLKKIYGSCPPTDPKYFQKIAPFRVGNFSLTLI